jgi:hypothetical protein
MNYLMHLVAALVGVAIVVIPTIFLLAIAHAVFGMGG